MAPFTETSGTFINTEGRIQSFNGVVPSAGETRPAWKVLRVLANLMQLNGFEYDSSEQIRAEIISADTEFASGLNNVLETYSISDTSQKNIGIERIGEVTIYQADPIVRRAGSLQKTHDSALPIAFASPILLNKSGIKTGETVKVKQQSKEIQVEISSDANLPDNCVRLACAHTQTSELGGMFDEIRLEKL